MQNEQALLWAQPVWQAEAQAWIRAELNRLGIEITGEIEQFHVYPWSTVMRVPAGRAPVYFKAVASVLAYEPRLTQMLSQRMPEHVPQVLAIDTSRAWMLTADMGSTLRIYLKETRDLSPLREALPHFARLQIEMIPHAADLAAMGAPVHTLSRIVQAFGEISQDTNLLSSSEYALSAEQQARLRGMTPRVQALADTVEAAGLPLSLHHDDFHDANIFFKDGRVIFSDWGDCVVTHPFFSPLILMRSVSDTLETTEDAPEILALRDVFLEPWAAHTGQDDLVALFEHTWRLGMLNRVLSWYEYIRTLDEPYRSRYAYTVPGWLQDFLEIMDS